MTMALKMLGVLMIASPFIGVAVLGTLSIGLMQTIGVFIVCGLILAVVSVGIHLAML